MATSLASQLYRMSTVDRMVSTERAQKTRASFLFDGKQAADMDMQTIFDIGRDGLSDLCKVDIRFRPYASTLFSEAVKDMDRVLQTREENNKLDETIRSFLFLMARHFLTKPAGKALEWLIRRFRIQEFNAKDILAAIMPFHETKAFLSMLTIITFTPEDMHLFGFLVTQRKARRLLDQATLMAQCMIDRSLLAFICNSTLDACNKGVDYPGMHSFYAAIMSQYIGQLSTVNDSTIQFVLPYVLDGLNLSSVQTQIAAYMVLGALATRVTFTQKAVEQVLCAVAQEPGDMRAMTMCLTQIVQAQAHVQNEVLPKKLVRLLAAHKDFPKAVGEFGAEYNINALVQPLLVSLAHYAFSGDAKLAQLLVTFIPIVHVSAVDALCDRVVREYIACGGAQGEGAASEIIDSVQLRFGQQLEDAIGAVAGRTEKQEEHRLLYELKTRVSSGSRSNVLPLKETATTLFLSINHADAGVRLVAAKALSDIVEGTRDFVLSEAEAAELVLDRLRYEDNVNVLSIVLSMNLSQMASGSDLIKALVSVIASDRVPLESLIRPLVGHLLAIDVSQDDALYSQVATALFPYLLVSQAPKQVTQSIVSAIPNSALASDTSGWLSCLSKLKGVALDKKFNKTVVDLLAAKFAQDPDACDSLWKAQLKTGSHLALAVGARAVDLLAASGNQQGAVDVANAVIAASKRVFTTNSKELQNLESADGVLVQSTESPAWNALLADSQPTAIAAGAFSAVLSTLPRLGTLQPNRWFVEADGAGRDESAYRSAVRAAYSALVSRGDGLANVDGVLIGRMLSSCLGDEWAEFLAATWVSSDQSATARAHSLLAFAALAQHLQKPGTDYQTLLPAVVVALADSDQGVRAAAYGCLSAMKALYQALEKDKAEQNIYQYDAIYGAQSTRLQYLPLSTVARLVALLESRSYEIFENSWTVRTELEHILAKGTCTSSSAGDKQSLLPKLNSQARAAVGMFLVSHIAATDCLAPSLQLSLLSVLESAAPAGALEQLFPLIAAHVQALQQSGAVPVSGSSDDNVLRALFRACYSPSTATELRGPDGSAYWLALLAYAAGGDDRLAAYIQQLAFERLGARGFVASLGAEAVTDITSCLLRVADAGNSYEQSGAGSRMSLRALFASLQLDAEAAADELGTVADRLGAGAKNADQPAGKKAKKSGGEKPGSVAELAALLEFVGCSQSLATDAALVPALFSLLHVFVAEGITDALVPDEYIKQLVLGLLTRIFDSANERSVVISESAIRVDVIVQTIRTSPSPQTHNQTLALLAAVATQHPQAVLHHVMAVFTFMGANVLRQDDEYSFHVIQQTLEKVLPPLVRLPNAASRAVQVTHAGPVLRVFVDALSHIPRHRRMALFSTLVRTMGPAEYAPAVVSLLLEKNVAKILKAAGQAEDRDVASFALSLVHGMSAEEQIHTATVLARDLAQLPAEPSADVECGDVYIDVAHMQTRELRTYRLVALDFAHQLLTSRQFAAAFSVVATKASVNSLLAAATATLLETTATLAQQHAQLSAEGKLSANVAETAWRKAVQLCYSVLDDVNALMDRRTFVSTVVGLLQQNDLKVQRKVLALANTKLAAFDTRLIEQGSAEIDELLEMMVPVAQLTATQGDAAELVACKQAALLCVATAAKKFAALRPVLFTEIAGMVIAPSSLQSTSVAVVSSALVALAVLCSELGSRLIPRLPQYLPTVLKHLHAVVGRLSDSAALQDDLALLASALSAMQAIVENMSAFLAPSLSPLFAILMHPSLRAIKGSNDANDLSSQVREKADGVLTALYKSIPPRQLLPAQFAFYQKEASKQGAETLAAFVDFVGKTAGSLQRNHLMQFYKPLFKFFLSVFDVTRNPMVPLADVSVIEDAALSAFMRFVIKLNENLFKPLFLSFVEWATADPSSLPASPAWSSGAAVSAVDKELRVQSANEARLRVFYRTLNELFDKLKSIVAPYYSSVIDTTVAQLERYGVSLDSIELQEEADRAEKPVPSDLWCAMVQSLYNSALYDSGAGFWTDANFLKVYRPLANQLANTKAPIGTAVDSAYEMYVARVRMYLAPAASQLSAAAGNDAMWKSLNQETMMKSRSDDPAVRVGALLVLQSFYEKLGEEFLILLPETIPYLAELLEDDNSRVERTTQETIKVIESYLGESLQTYLK